MLADVIHTMIPERRFASRSISPGQNHRPIDNFAPGNAKLPRRAAE
jgi:hypothetical protein